MPLSRLAGRWDERRRWNWNDMMICNLTTERYHDDAGMIGLANEIHESTTAELIEQRDLISDIHPALWHLARPRLALVLDELARCDHGPRLRLLTSAELLAEFGT